MGRMTALRKADGVRGIVVGDLFLVALKAATSPFQHALSTKVGTECVTHILHTFTDEKLTILQSTGLVLSTMYPGTQCCEV